MHRKYFLFIFFPFIVSSSFAQLTNAEKKVLEKEQVSLRPLAIKIIRGRTPEERFIADSEFTRTFVRALKTPHSFHFSFDSLVTISQLWAEDSSFKIFTWQLVMSDYETRQHGAIQMNTADGSLKLFPLIDKSDVMDDPEDSIGNNFDWYGAVYYKLIETHSFGKNFYTLLGFDENNINSNKKIIDVLTFDKSGRPVFGGGYFSIPDNDLVKKYPARFIMEYKKNAGPRLNFDSSLNMIIYEHLISETGEPQKKYTYIPDGDYEGLVWRDGMWVHVNKVFTQVTPEGHEPVPQPILDDKGNVNETILSDKSIQNMNTTDSTKKETPKNEEQ